MFKNHGAKVSNFFQAGNTAFTEQLHCMIFALPLDKIGCTSAIEASFIALVCMSFALK